MVELIVGIVVVGMLAVVTAPLLRMPTIAYLEARGRTELQSQADLLRGKMQDDLRRALPGSLRHVQVGTVWYLEFLQVRGWGRFRENNAGATGGTCSPTICNGAGLARSCPAENCFATIGDLQLMVTGSVPVTTDSVVIDPMTALTKVPTEQAELYNPTPNTYRSGVTSYTTVQALPPVRQLQFQTTPAGFVPTMLVPAPNRFYVVSQPVTYVCDPAAGTLTRRSGYAAQTTQPTAFAASVTSALMSNRITSCKLDPTTVLSAGWGGSKVSYGQLLRTELTLTQAIPGQPDEVQRIWLQIAVKEP